MRAPQHSVSVVIRATGARDTIAGTVECALRLESGRARPEIVLVHDCSRDGTWPCLVELKRRHPELHLVDLGSPYGHGLSLIEGVRRASGDRVCVVAPDADAVVLARAIEEARRREAVVSSLEGGLSEAARERLERPLFAQAFAPGVRLHLDDAEVAEGAAATDQRSPRRRRSLLLVPVAVGCAAAGMTVALAGKSSEQAAASPPARESAAVAPASAAAPSLPVPRAEPGQLAVAARTDPAPPRRAQRVREEERRGASRATDPPPGSRGAGSDPGVATTLGGSGSDASGDEQPHPAGQGAPPAGAPSADATPSQAPAAQAPPGDTAVPADVAAVSPSAGGGGGAASAAGAETVPAAEPSPTPAAPSAASGGTQPEPSPPEPPQAEPPPAGGEPPATGPGNGNGNAFGQGNGNAYGQGNGNGQGGGNGNGNAYGQDKR